MERKTNDLKLNLVGISRLVMQWEGSEEGIWSLRDGTICHSGKEMYSFPAWNQGLSYLRHVFSGSVNKNSFTPVTVSFSTTVKKISVEIGWIFEKLFHKNSSVLDYKFKNAWEFKMILTQHLINIKHFF